MSDKNTLTLRQAAEEYGYTVSTLRAEAGRGRLTLYRIGRKDYTTPADIKEMVRLCRVEKKGHGFTLIRDENNGLSATERASSALAAANQTVEALKRRSPNILDTSTSQRRQVRR